MKKKLIAISVITVISITPAFADYIESPRGISQSEWHASSTYQNFQCPTGTSRGEGVDLNFTTTRSDDFYFVTCTPIVIIPKPTPIPIPISTPVISETSTVTVIPTITENTNISSSSVSSETTTTTPTPVVIETSTATSTTTTTLTNSQLLALIMNLINQLMSLIAQMK